jgi:hypothetical protein
MASTERFLAICALSIFSVATGCAANTNPLEDDSAVDEELDAESTNFHWRFDCTPTDAAEVQKNQKDLGYALRSFLVREVPGKSAAAKPITNVAITQSNRKVARTFIAASNYAPNLSLRASFDKGDGQIELKPVFGGRWLGTLTVEQDFSFEVACTLSTPVAKPAAPSACVDTKDRKYTICGLGKCAAADFTCPAGQRRFDDTKGCGCQPLSTPTPACVDTKDRKYTICGLGKCAAADFTCPAGQRRFDDANGCGCEAAPTPPPNRACVDTKDRKYTICGLGKCAVVDFTCSAGQRRFDDPNGCGCQKL